MSFDLQDPCTWPRSSASIFIIGVDLALMADRSTKIVAGYWGNIPSYPIGLVDMKQYPIGFPLDELAQEVADDLHKYPNSRCLFDATNNTAWAGTLANRVPHPSQKVIGCVFTNGDAHAAMPETMIVSVNGKPHAIYRWSLSKRSAFFEMSAEFDAKTLRIGQNGDRQVLIDEFKSIQAGRTASGKITMSAPTGKNDDMVAATALAVFGCRRLGGAYRPRRAKSRGHGSGRDMWAGAT
jgi:hypothetical protein